jgi:hypothetical protein
MPGTPTTRLSLPVPAAGDPADGPGGIGALATALDPEAAIFLQGTLGSRPAPAIQGRFFFDWGEVTANQSYDGVLYMDTGTSWVQVSPKWLNGRNSGVMLPGEFSVCGGAGPLTLPQAPPLNSRAGLINITGVTVTLNAASGDTISSYGVTGSSITVPAGRSVELQYGGSNTWYVTSAPPWSGVALSTNQPTGTFGLSNGGYARPANACVVNFTTTQANQPVEVTGHAVVDLASDPGQYYVHATIMLDAGGIYSIAGAGGTGVFGASFNGVSVLSGLIVTGSISGAVANIVVAGTSGSGDYGGVHATTPMAVGNPITINIPTPGAHALDWEFYIDAGATYNVNNQYLAVKL